MISGVQLSGFFGELEKIAALRDATQEDLSRYNIKDIKLKRGQQVKIDVENGKFRGLAALKPSTGELTGLYVAPQYRRQGIATSLLKSFSAQPTSAIQMAKNDKARGFYESQGFKETGSSTDSKGTALSVMTRQPK
jgi:ribosomal protein S18 acetylase RimI-like enzyme